jgi:dTDP-4-amino-4,6-dideoxygalactose transaminase
MTTTEVSGETAMNRVTVPFFDYPSVFSSMKEEILAAVIDVGERGAFIQQQDLQLLERELAEFTGSRFVLGVGNATDGLHLAVRAAGIGAGDEVIFCSHTMVATPAAAVFAGATPVPVDCNAEHLIDPDSVEAAVTSRTRAIMPTQLNGRMCDMDELEAIAAKHDLLIIEDAAQALGARYRGKGAGTIGFAGAISFYPAKTLGCLGDGGLVMTQSEDAYERLKQLHNHGYNENGEVVSWGMNSRLDNLQAAILRLKLARYVEEINRRRAIAGRYCEKLGDLSELVLPPAPTDDRSHYDVFQNFEIAAEDRDRLRTHLSEHGVGTIIQWGGTPVHRFAGLGFKERLPRVEEFFTRCLLLPMHGGLRDGEIDVVCDAVRGFYQG